MKKVLTVLFVVFLLALEVGCGGGANWTNIAGGVSGSLVYSLAYDSGHIVLYAGTEMGVWQYHGTNWTDTGGGVSSTTVVSLAYDSSHNVLYAGTLKNGVWKYGGAK